MHTSKLTFKNVMSEIIKLPTLNMSCYNVRGTQALESNTTNLIYFAS